MMFDECPSWPATHDETRAAMERTLRWARRGRDRVHAIAAGPAPDVPRPTPGQVQFGIIQGGTYKDLRDECVAGTVAVGFEAYAIGGLSVGEPVDVMYDIVGHTAAQLPGGPSAVPDGHRHAGRPLRKRGPGHRPLRLRAADAERPERPVVHAPGAAGDQERAVRRGRAATRSGLRLPDVPAAFPGLSATPLHGRARWRRATLNTLHNLYFYLDTMRSIRKAIEFGTFEELKRAFLETYSRRQPELMTDVLDTPLVVAMAQPGQAQPNFLVQLFPFALMLLIFYLLVLLPMRRRQKKVQDFQSSLKVGDKVMTTGGIFGQVTESGRTTRPCRSRSPIGCASTCRAPPSRATRDRTRSSRPTARSSSN